MRDVGASVYRLEMSTYLLSFLHDTQEKNVSQVESNSVVEFSGLVNLEQLASTR